MPTADVKTLLSNIDINGDGRIDMQEFYSFVEYDMAEINAVLGKVHKQVQYRKDLGDSIEDVFNEYDKNNMKRLDKRQFRKGLVEIDVHLTEKELGTLCSSV